MLGEADKAVGSADSIPRSGLGSLPETSGNPSQNDGGEVATSMSLLTNRTQSEFPPSWPQDLVKQIVSELRESIEKDILQNLRDLSYALRVVSNLMQDSQHSSTSQKDEQDSRSSTGSFETPKDSSSGSWSGSDRSPIAKALPSKVRHALGIKIPSPEVVPPNDRRPKVSTAAGSSSAAAGASSRSASSSDAAPTTKRNRFGSALTPVVSRSSSQESSPSVQRDSTNPPESTQDQHRPRAVTGTFGRDEPADADQDQQAESFGQASPAGVENTAEMLELQPKASTTASHHPSSLLEGPFRDASLLVPGEMNESVGVQLDLKKAGDGASKLFVAEEHLPNDSSSPCGQDAADEREEEAQLARGVSFQDFEDRKEKNGNRTPCSLFDMEEDVLLLNLEHLHRKKKRSKRPRRHKPNSSQSLRPLAKILPESADDPEEAAKVSENEKCRESSPRTEPEHIPVKVTRKPPSSDKYETYQEAGDSRDVSAYAGKGRTNRSMDRLYSEHAQDILDNYTGLRKQKSAQDPGQFFNAKLDRWYASFCGSRVLCALKELPEWCLILFGITRPGNEMLPSHLSRIYFFFALLLKGLLVAYVLIQDFAVEFDNIYYTRFMRSLIAIGALVSSLCLLEGGTGALLGGRCDAIKMYAQHNYFLDAWRTKSLTYFSLIFVCCAAQSVLLVYEAPGADSEECRDGGLRISGPSELTTHVLVVALMSMLAFLHLRMCAGLQLMVDSFCEDFKMGMDEIKAASRWNLIHGLMNRTTGTIGTCFLAQISTFAAALVPAGADVLVGNVGMDSACAIPWLVNWLIPTLLGFFVVYIGLIECGRLTLKCSRVAGFVNTMRYQQVTRNEAARNLRQYLTGFVHQTSSGFIIQGLRVTTFAAFKLGWALVTMAFAIWARSRST
eukprot:TRINITY_DN3799_c0_g1_i1.p1 TRINITY_DN3799_c0_g1~~TRINITY_DN3799_c0_g1_i1.p1  ORF type:complete len:900 (+),score=141.26 TRINITY_DN3799_c0_g1_i1:100-2799(+)